MCRACNQTPDGQGRHCLRDDGFSSVEGNQRNRTRGLNNAAEALAHGDPQGAVNQLENARRAQRTLDGVPIAPQGPPRAVPGPQRDIAISPSSIATVQAQVEQINRARTEYGQAPLTVEITRQNAADPDDALMTQEIATARISGAAEDELDQLSFSGVSTTPERRVRTTAVLEATCAITRVESEGAYVSRNDGAERSTPALVTQYVHDAPGGQLRQKYAPNQADVARAKSIRAWARETRPTNDYVRAMRHALAEEGLGPRDVGTAASALSGYERTYSEKSRADRMQEELMAKLAGGAPGGGGPSPGRPVYSEPRTSRWLNKPGDKVMVTGRVERVVKVVHEQRLDPRHLYIIRTPDGDAVKWLPSDFLGAQEGDMVTLRGQVKAHSEFRGEKQTEMYYCQPEIHINQ